MISPDGLSLFFSRLGEDDEYDKWVVTRDTKDAPWGDPVNIGTMLSHVDVWLGFTTADGLELYTSASEREGGYGARDLWMRRRDSRDAEWGPLENLGPSVNTWADEMWPTLSPDGLEMHFSGYNHATYVRPGGQGNSDLWVTRRPSREAPWGPPENLGPVVNSAAGDWRPCLSADGLLLFFDSYRSSGSGSSDLYVTRRVSLQDPWSVPMNLGPLINSSAFDECAAISADGTSLYYDTGRPGYGNHDIWRIPIVPTVDFNGDGQVGAREALRMANCWGTDDPLCDIGPMPWGDGIVDVEDLRVLAEHINEEVIDLSLAAHWALDETEGDIAHDSSSGNDGQVQGEPVWKSQGGVLSGAMEFDGVDDCIQTPRIVSLTSESFSVLAWVKGGAPCQVVLSAADHSNWLLASMSNRDGVGANLQTEFGPHALTSNACIGDGQWHHIGFVWDGTSRTLYVDGLPVAEDVPLDVQENIGRLYIGCGADRSPGSYFAGLIDEVRIYNRVVRP